MGLNFRHHSFAIRHYIAMRRLIEATQDVKPVLVGTAGTGTTAILDGVNAAVGILVGLATLVYLIVRIQKELKR